MNREEIAWAAGFFDGEGSAGNTKKIRRSRRSDVRVLPIGEALPVV